MSLFQQLLQSCLSNEPVSEWNSNIKNQSKPWHCKHSQNSNKTKLNWKKIRREEEDYSVKTCWNVIFTDPTPKTQQTTNQTTPKEKKPRIRTSGTPKSIEETEQIDENAQDREAEIATGLHLQRERARAGGKENKWLWSAGGVCLDLNHRARILELFWPLVLCSEPKIENHRTVDSWKTFSCIFFHFFNIKKINKFGTLLVIPWNFKILFVTLSTFLPINIVGYLFWRELEIEL